MFRNGEQLDIVVPHIFDISDQFVRKLGIFKAVPVRIPFPRAGVDLVQIDGLS
jgi:hypothetical protein